MKNILITILFSIGVLLMSCEKDDLVPPTCETGGEEVTP